MSAPCGWWKMILTAAMAIALAFTSIGSAEGASAAYRDRSGELEGTDATPYIIAGAVVVTAVVVYVIVKKHKSNDEEKEQTQNSSDARLVFPTASVDSRAGGPRTAMTLSLLPGDLPPGLARGVQDQLPVGARLGVCCRF